MYRRHGVKAEFKVETLNFYISFNQVGTANSSLMLYRHLNEVFLTGYIFTEPATFKISHRIENVQTIEVYTMSQWRRKLKKFITRIYYFTIQGNNCDS